MLARHCRLAGSHLIGASLNLQSEIITLMILMLPFVLASFYGIEAAPKVPHRFFMPCRRLLFDQRMLSLLFYDGRSAHALRWPSQALGRM